MFEQLDLQALTDVGFVLLVTVACAKATFGGGDGAALRRARWKQELQELQVGLRDLIVEAGSASSNLDRSLLQRKRELEVLLGKLDSNAPQRAAEEKGKAKSKRPVSERTTPAFADNDLPNATWQQPLARGSHRDYDLDGQSVGSTGEGLNSSENAESWSDTTAHRMSQDTHESLPPWLSESNFSEKLNPAAKQQASTVEKAPARSFASSSGPDLANNRLQGYTRAKTPPRNVEAMLEAENQINFSLPYASQTQHISRAQPSDELTLKEQIELIADDDLQKETFEQTSIMDVTTYQIARRLLHAGREIHVVARKLELPVSEIRLLDRLLRQEDAIRESRHKRLSDAVQKELETRKMGGEEGQPEHWEKRSAPRVGFQQQDEEFSSLGDNIEREIVLV